MDEKIKEIASKIYINPSNEVLESLKKEYNFIKENLKLLEEIDTTNVEPMTRISPPINLLRDDKIDPSILIKKEVVLKNASNKDDDYIIMKRIIA